VDDTTALSAAAERNKGPILDVLTRVLPAHGVVLEVASGTGQHVVHFAKALAGLTWQPSEADAHRRRSIASRVERESLANVSAPLDLDVTRLPWPIQAATAVVCINMIHVAPWAAAEALFEGARALLPAQHVLFLYGPYRRFGLHTAQSNAAFDLDLRERDRDWGLRDMEAVAESGRVRGFALREVVDMPANNFSLVFARVG
jgi:hypothetical protein